MKEWVYTHPHDPMLLTMHDCTVTRIDLERQHLHELAPPRRHLGRPGDRGRGDHEDLPYRRGLRRL